jgi:hypothetical protein
MTARSGYTTGATGSMPGYDRGLDTWSPLVTVGHRWGRNTRQVLSGD